MPAALKVHYFLRPQGAHQVDLFLGADAASGEILAQRLELHVVPANADAQGEAAATEHVDLGGLLGHQGGLALGQDEDAGDEANALRQRGDECQRSQRLMDDAVVSVVVVADMGMVGRIGSQHVVGDEQVVELHLLDGLHVVADGGRVRPDFGLGEDCANLHGNLW